MYLAESVHSNKLLEIQAAKDVITQGTGDLCVGYSKEPTTTSEFW